MELDDVKNSDVELDNMKLGDAHITAEPEVLLKSVELLLSSTAEVNITVIITVWSKILTVENIDESGLGKI